MLDNMDIETIKKAVKIINKKAMIEVSGNVSINTIRSIAETTNKKFEYSDIIYFR